jgi:glyoxylase-like metal-dependent hydrolase (beta-lactamase superfamily II)
MKVIKIQGTGGVYTSNVYLITGEWRRLGDVNTLVDVGNDPSIVEVLAGVHAGVGKKKVEQVVLTHGHSDHTGSLSHVKAAFGPSVCAFSPFLDGVDRVLSAGETLHIGDRSFEVVHVPGHTEDSIALYCEEEQALFVGDSPVIVRSIGGTYEPGFIAALEGLCERRVERIYFGHGDPLVTNASNSLRLSLANVLASVRAAGTPSSPAMPPARGPRDRVADCSPTRDEN